MVLALNSEGNTVCPIVENVFTVWDYTYSWPILHT